MRTSESFLINDLAMTRKQLKSLFERDTSELQGVSLSALNFTKCQFLALGTTPCTVGLTQQ